MNFHANPFTIQNLLSSRKIYKVPKYQREFSWSKEGKVFLNDVLDNIGYDKTKEEFYNKDYFFGNILLQGDMSSTDSNKKEVYIIDGQQRLTTITIILSVIYDLFKEESQQTLAENVFGLIKGSDMNGNPFFILRNETPQPYFQFKIQKENPSETPKTEEEKRIEDAYSYVYTMLSSKKLVKYFQSKFPDSNINYIGALSAVRDQLLNSTIIVCWTEDKDYASLIFEILNAKGMELSEIDLIKNKVFSFFDDSSDFPDSKWKEIVHNLSAERIPFSVFFSHYWNSINGKRITASKLYDSFNSKNKKLNEQSCKDFLNDLAKFSKIYSICLNPKLTDFDNNRDNQLIVDSLLNISDFDLKMPRVCLIHLYDKFINKVIKPSLLRETVKFIEKFHFIYNIVCSEKTNVLDNIYCDFSSKLHNSNDNNECARIIRDFKSKMKNKLPQFDYFKSSIIGFKYSSKKRLSTNMGCKYFIKEIENDFSTSSPLSFNDYTIEHILNENIEDDETLTISRLILLEKDLNGNIGNMNPLSKGVEYNKSYYKYPKVIAKKISEANSITELKDLLDKSFEGKVKQFYDSI